MADASEEKSGNGYDSLVQRHKKEKKELMGKIQSFKHSVPKGDKKKKKEITLEIAKLETQLEERQKKEIDEFLSKENMSGYEQLRRQASDYMSSHSEDFLPFLIHSESGELYTTDEFIKYCQDVAVTSTWGGQLE
ncbi:hypothetical protein QZH41_016626, partial [Actinostola sp. cb2023]